MGQKMSHAILGAESMDVLDIVSDLGEVPSTRVNTGSGEVRVDSSGFVEAKSELVNVLSNLYVPEVSIGDLHENALVFPVSLATLFHLDSNLDGRFRSRDVGKVRGAENFRFDGISRRTVLMLVSSQNPVDVNPQYSDAFHLLCFQTFVLDR